ncbi:calcium-dependent protein kinase 14-like [Asparagus officinalis]|uniref:calcium-dependent protein kinase 14-like n=1 Tax=Asparagus officinalis TaxID=4686 RepID=UPI00098E557F|nr:calcium-dependent protein kinase 14-like [Asparagus officinalis]
MLDKSINQHLFCFSFWFCRAILVIIHGLNEHRLKQFRAMNKFKKAALRVIAGCLSEEEIRGLKEMFKGMDTDNSGTITLEELKQGLTKQGTKLSEMEVKQLMEAADADGNGTIDYEEFITATMHMNRMDREEHLYTAFQYFDKDNSGFITIEDLEQALKEKGLYDGGNIKDIILDADSDNLHNKSWRWMVKVGRRSQRRDEGKACNVDKTWVLCSLYCSSLLNHDCWIC